MIDISYNNGKIKITTGDLNKVFTKAQLPLKIEITKSVSKEVIWSTNLDNNMWGEYPNNEINDVVVKDAEDKEVFTYHWNLIDHGSIFYKSLWFYCKSLLHQGKRPVGLVVGTHDGEFGEWVPVVIENLSDALLVEGSKPQFDKLTANYYGRSNVFPLYDLITPEGDNVVFYEGGRGYTNSIVERVIRSWETEEIKSTQRTSTSINYLLNKYFSEGIHWLHLDVEGLDAKLLMSLEDKNIPPFIIFEHNNLPEIEKKEIDSWLISKGFRLHYGDVSCLANKS